jgi:endonuclease/exonuclease/phosphatase (EEP) superfamily protein YafD
MRQAHPIALEIARFNQVFSFMPQSSAPAAWFWRFIQWLAVTTILVAGACTLLAFAARGHWRLELMSHFRAQYFWTLALAAVLLAFARLRRLAWIAVALSTVNLVLIVPLYFGPATLADGPVSRGMSLNVYFHNRDYERTLELIRREDPDFILLLEVTPDWAEAMRALETGYPHGHLEPRKDSGGMALFSRVPIEDLEVRPLVEYGPSTILARLALPSGTLTLIGAHTSSPKTPRHFAIRNEELLKLGKMANSRAGAVMLLGDMNCTSWSPYFQDTLTVSGLVDSRRGFGVEGSWPDLPLPLRIPIDHCLTTPDVSIKDRRIGADVGSDHRPLIVDFSIAKAK